MFLKTLCLLIVLASFSSSAQSQPASTLDLNLVSTQEGLIFRLLGSVGDGIAGVPVAGGYDMDGGGVNDFAMASFLADPMGRDNAGQIFLVFGNNQISGDIDTLNPNPRVLVIQGAQISEHAGSELWMSDVTGDGLGDLLICRQDYSLPGRLGIGALTLIPGQAQLSTMAVNGDILDLASPPPGLQIIDILGATSGSRLCIWARTGDVTGDGVDDFVAGADRETSGGNFDAGTVYVFRGGSYLQTSQTIDLADFVSASPGAPILGNVARIQPPAGSEEFHFGATVQIADLDGNGRSEVLMAAALNRSGASLGPPGGSGHGSGGAEDGTLYIAWDDNFTGDWIPTAGSPLDFFIDSAPGSHTSINGHDVKNDVFGEEILAGLDFDNDGNADLFAGDLTARGWGDVVRTSAGTGHVIYNAASLKGMDIDLSDSPLPDGFSMSVFIGPVAGAIGGDTAMHGDFNGDGIDDLAFSSPHDSPLGRFHAGTMHIILGQQGEWPEVIDLAPGNLPDPDQIRILEIYGANGQGAAGDAGDTLSYSGAFGDMNGDGVTDIITNEMQGNGSTPETIDVGNLLIIDVLRILDKMHKDSFE